MNDLERTIEAAAVTVGEDVAREILADAKEVAKQYGFDLQLAFEVCYGERLAVSEGSGDELQPDAERMLEAFGRFAMAAGEAARSILEAFADWCEMWSDEWNRVQAVQELHRLARRDGRNLVVVIEDGKIVDAWVAQPGDELFVLDSGAVAPTRSSVRALLTEFGRIYREE